MGVNVLLYDNYYLCLSILLPLLHSVIVHAAVTGSVQAEAQILKNQCSFTLLYQAVNCSS